jgi:hypothetical protein
MLSLSNTIIRRPQSIGATAYLRRSPVKFVSMSTMRTNTTSIATLAIESTWSSVGTACTTNFVKLVCCAMHSKSTVNNVDSNGTHFNCLKYPAVCNLHIDAVKFRWKKEKKTDRIRKTQGDALKEFRGAKKARKARGPDKPPPEKTADEKDVRLARTGREFDRMFDLYDSEAG